MNITLSGFPGTGTTTVGNIVAKKLNMDFISSGEIFRDFAKEKGMTLAEFGKLCEENSAIDKLIDSKQKELSLKKDNIIFEGRLSGHMCESQLKILLFAPRHVRTKRVSTRDKKPINEVLEKIIKREKSEAKRYKQYYDIDIHDISVYDLVIDSSKTTAEEISDIIVKKFSELKLKK